MMSTEIVERRPMGREERAMWIRKVKQAQATDQTCRRCGKPATLCFGDVLGDQWYCDPHGETQRNKRAVLRRA